MANRNDIGRNGSSGKGDDEKWPSFPEDEDDFEESVAEIKERLEGILFDSKRKFRTEYFLTGYDAAYRTVCSWFRGIRNFESVYEAVDRETYLNICYMLCDKVEKIEKDALGVFVLDKLIPEEGEITSVETRLYSQLWLLRWFHDVVFALRPYDELFQEGEYTEDNFEQWVQDWVSYDHDSLLSVTCDVCGYLHEDGSPEEFKDFAKAYVGWLDLADSFFAFLEG